VLGHENLASVIITFSIKGLHMVDGYPAKGDVQLLKR
jgi:hypothetical protein